MGRVAAVGGERGAVCPPRPVPGLPPEDILAEKTGGGAVKVNRGRLGLTVWFGLGRSGM